jgi:hypothetical protein
MNFGFETSLSKLNKYQNFDNNSCRGLLADDALIIAPLSSDPEGSLEQTYSLIQY